jgi:hypothetical protein
MQEQRAKTKPAKERNINGESSMRQIGERENKSAKGRNFKKGSNTLTAKTQGHARRGREISRFRRTRQHEVQFAKNQMAQKKKVW